jgi:hypothetical protein
VGLEELVSQNPTVVKSNHQAPDFNVFRRKDLVHEVGNQLQIVLGGTASEDAYFLLWRQDFTNPSLALVPWQA